MLITGLVSQCGSQTQDIKAVTAASPNQCALHCSKPAHTASNTDTLVATSATIDAQQSFQPHRMELVVN